MQIGLSVYVLFGLQLLILPFQLISYASRKSDFERRQFLIFSLSYFLLNLTWIGVHNTQTTDYVPEELLSLSCIFVILYSYYYFSITVGLKVDKKSVSRLLIHVSIVALLMFFNNFFREGLANWLLLIILIYMELIIFYFTSRIILQIQAKKCVQDKVRTYSILAATLLAIFIPFVFFFLNNSTLQYASMNIGYFVVAFSYIFVHIQQTRKEWFQLDEFRSNSEMDEFAKNKVYNTLKNVSNLTSREIEIAELMMQGLMWKEIAARLNISEKTATKHGSNIYSKFNVSKREEFIEQFKSLINK